MWNSPSHEWVEVLSGWASDYEWDMGNLTFTLENRRYGEKCISYAESHDQEGSRLFTHSLLTLSHCLRACLPASPTHPLTHSLIRSSLTLSFTHSLTHLRTTVV